MRHALTLLLHLASLITSTACSRGRPPATYDPGSPVAIVVRNNNSQDVDIYAFGDGGRRRLGTLVSHTTETYFLEAGFLGSSRMLRLTAQPIANRSGGAQASVGVQPGQEVRWTLETSLARSYISVQ
jgi:hypothetical protein